MIPETLEWRGEALRIIDQRALPDELVFWDCATVREVAEAIRTLAVRGAPAIGIAAAYGVALGARADRNSLDSVIRELASTRPTAVNLFWALERMRRVITLHSEAPDDVFAECLAREAGIIKAEDIANNKKIGSLGQALLPEKAAVLTHCNAGALATGGHGTALGVIRSARETGKDVKVYADETRPLLQGARLTAWELSADGFDVTLICDSMAGALMKSRAVDAVVVGADRIAANGDVANKIGTYGLAVLASYHGVPFYVAAPRSTLDLAVSSGADIPIEERSSSEVRELPRGGSAPEAAAVWNPAFDVTPAELITAIIMETGVYRAPWDFREGAKISGPVRG
ncbi:MAG: S-methyl-5-thioribose-1-phosphate isomerase [Synergistaceae bacterium]|jgi:methylthioribose-1-phosphate isomerase|nr:S-methyl-5-thioribose-1-phosphate isomerase [Synergistaceae bacterium]